MKRILFWVGLLVSFVLLTSVAIAASNTLAAIQQKGEVVIATTGTQEPFSIMTNDGRIMGMDIDLGQFIAKAMGVTPKFVIYPFDQLHTIMELGMVDMAISGMTMTPARQEKMTMVGPYHITGKSLLAHLSNAQLRAIADVKGLQDFDNPNLTLAALSGSTSEQLIRAIMPKSQIWPVKGYDEAVTLMRERRVTALVADYPVCLMTIYRYPNEQLYTLPRPFTIEPLGIAIAKNNPTLEAWLANFLVTAANDGLLDELTVRWIEQVPTWVDMLNPIPAR